MREKFFKEDELTWKCNKKQTLYKVFFQQLYICAAADHSKKVSNLHIEKCTQNGVFFLSILLVKHNSFMTFFLQRKEKEMTFS